MKIICMGDSLTEGDYGLPGQSGIANVQPESYPYFLAKHTGWTVVNAGHCGYRATDYWNYLQSERSATETAVRLHMHRNTVIYHIDRIQKRFDFDLEVKAARDWLLVHFKMLFASLSNESVAEILSKD